MTMAKTIIRPATHDDLDNIAEIGLALHSESTHFNRCGYSTEKVALFLGSLILSEDGLVLVVERDGSVIGGIAASAVEQWFSFDKIAVDVSVFILPEHRGGMAAIRLLHAYRDWAKAKGVVYALAGISTGINCEKTQALYERIGMSYLGPIMAFSMEREKNGS